MKILFKQFIAKNHSWSVVGQNLAMGLLKNNHQVHLFSTNGLTHFPDHLRDNLIGYSEERERTVFGKAPDQDYDMQISYTAMPNFANYLSHGKKNRFGIWCYEFFGKNAIPNGFSKYHHYTDKLLPPSNFAKQIFLDSGIPEEKMTVIPHSIDIDRFKNQTNKYNIKTNAQVKILCNIAQLHLRKGLDLTLDAYGKAFTNKDDVCLILKIVDKIPTQQFELAFQPIWTTFKNKYKNHAEVKVVKEYITDMSELYKSADILFSLTRAEAFYLPGLEALASGLLVISPRWGGQLDFLNDSNSLLVDGQMTPANPEALYWEQRRGTYWFTPSVSDAVEKLRYAVSNIDKLKQEKLSDIDTYIYNYSHESITNKLLGLAK